MLKGWHLQAPTEFTCTGKESVSTIDFFLVNTQALTLLHCDDAVKVHRRHRIATHVPVAIKLNRKGGDSKVKVLIPQVKPEPHPVVGPHQSHTQVWTDWQDVKVAEKGLGSIGTLLWQRMIPSYLRLWNGSKGCTTSGNIGFYPSLRTCSAWPSYHLRSIKSGANKLRIF